MSNSPVWYSRWLPLLTIEISYIDHYYLIVFKMSSFFKFFRSAYLNRLCKLGLFWYEINLEIFSLETIDPNQTKEGWHDFEWPTCKIVSNSTALHTRWPPFLKVVYLINHCYFLLSQNGYSDNCIWQQCTPSKRRSLLLKYWHIQLYF